MACENTMGGQSTADPNRARIKNVVKKKRINENNEDYLQLGGCHA